MPPSAVDNLPVPSAKPKTPKEPPEPNDVVRETAGNYVSGDARFEVRESETNWYLVDRQQTNEFGQELIHGPFGSLKAARSAMPGAREIKPLLRSRPRPKPTQAKSQATPSPRPASWIDKLSPKERTEVRRLIRALEREGMDDPEDLVRKDRQTTLPFIATELITRRLNALVNDFPEGDREEMRRLVQSAAEILVDDGATNDQPLPRWALVELPKDEKISVRRIRVRI